MNRSFTIITAAIIGLLTAAIPTRAADDLEIEIDRLKSEMTRSSAGWHVGIKYEVEIENARKDEPFAIRFSLRERGRPVRDDQGQAVVVLLPLDRPVSVDDDEREYKDVLTIDLPPALIRFPSHLRLVAHVVAEDESHVFAVDDTRVRFERPDAFLWTALTACR